MLELLGSSKDSYSIYLSQRSRCRSIGYISAELGLESLRRFETGLMITLVHFFLMLLLIIIVSMGRR